MGRKNLLFATPCFGKLKKFCFQILYFVSTFKLDPLRMHRLKIQEMRMTWHTTC